MLTARLAITQQTADSVRRLQLDLRERYGRRFTIDQTLAYLVKLYADTPRHP